MDQLTLLQEPKIVVRVGAGPLAIERLLLEDLDRTLGTAGESLLQQPLLVIVPSRSLRLHLQRRILRHLGRGLAGIEIATHHGLAMRLVRAAGQRGESGVDLLGLFARRFAAGEPALSRSLDHLADGYRSVLTAVGDLLEAGLEPSHLEGVEDALSAEGHGVASKAEIARAHAVVRVAVKSAAAMAELGIESTTTLLARAEDLALRPETGTTLSRYCGIAIYGYSDATGLTIDFLQSLLGLCGGTLYLDRPPDPARSSETDSGVRFARNFTERMTASLPGGLPETSTEPPGEVEMFSALGDDAEVREIASRIRRLLDAGVEPEEIGVVARTLEPSKDRIRTHFRRLGIPFSGVGAKAPRHPRANRFAALIDLLELGARTSLERWLEARNASESDLERYDIRLAFHSRGFGRIEEIGSLEVDDLPPSELLELPFGQTFALETASDSTGTRCRIQRRTITREAFGREIEKAKSIARALESASRSQTAGQHLEALQALVREELDWPEEDELSRRFLSAVRTALAPLPEDFSLAADEFADLAGTVSDSLFGDLIGGDGGGVQVLDVTEARARTFEHLFILGLDRSRFPRTVREDSVLPDSLRHVLARSGHSVLGDLPLKRDGFVEERFLFAQLLASSRSMTLSWTEIDDDGSARTTSPLVERLRWSVEREHGRTWGKPPTALPVFATNVHDAALRIPRPAYESAVLAGISADHGNQGFRNALEVALEEEVELSSTSARTLTNARLAVLSEVERPPDRRPDGTTSSGLGPYFGLIGPVTPPTDPRGDETVYVTTLADMVKCPWKTFLARVLRVEPESDPLEALPSVDGRTIGNLAHAVLQEIVESATGRAPVGLDEVRARVGTYVPWPTDNDLSQLVTRQAHRLLRKEGIFLPGFERALERVVIDYLRTARDWDWEKGTSRNRVVAAELYAHLPRPDLDISIGFKADRVDRTDDGLLLTDYKTGKMIFPSALTQAKPPMIGQQVREGAALQAAVYAEAAAGPGDRGRYLFIKPDYIQEVRASVPVSASEQEISQALEVVLDTTVGAWRGGAFFPRLSEPRKDEEPRTCEYCDFAQSCQRGDSSARQRIRSWAADGPSETPRSAADRSLDHIASRLWFVSTKRKAE